MKMKSLQKLCIFKLNLYAIKVENKKIVIDKNPIIPLNIFEKYNKLKKSESFFNCLEDINNNTNIYVTIDPDFISIHLYESKYESSLTNTYKNKNNNYINNISKLITSKYGIISLDKSFENTIIKIYNIIDNNNLNDIPDEFIKFNICQLQQNIYRILYFINFVKKNEYKKAIAYWNICKNEIYEEILETNTYYCIDNLFIIKPKIVSLNEFVQNL